MGGREEVENGSRAEMMKEMEGGKEREGVSAGLATVADAEGVVGRKRAEEEVAEALDQLSSVRPLPFPRVLRIDSLPLPFLLHPPLIDHPHLLLPPPLHLFHLPHLLPNLFHFSTPSQLRSLRFRDVRPIFTFPHICSSY